MNKYLNGRFCWLLIVVVGTSTLTASGQPRELQLASGTLVKIVSQQDESNVFVAHSQLVVSAEQTNRVVCAEIGGVKTNVQASLKAYKYTVSVSKNDTNSIATFYAMVVESDNKPPLWWFCTRAVSSTMPRDFKVFTTSSGNTYASYVDHGFKLFRVKTMSDVNVVWQDYWEQDQRTFDLVPSLDTTVLRQTVGEGPWYHFNSFYSTGVIDDISEIDGELRVTVHARTPEPKYTFALRDGKWAWVSTAGKDPYEGMTPTQILEMRNKAIGEQFEAEVKAKNEGKDPFEGMTRDQIREARDKAISKRIERIEAQLTARSGQTNNASGIQTNK
ncbi:MAG TPA: hypothetical protein VFZ59_03875 [Verrucomicrobiae bacterium]|nr:hypothetical protein [Verrucomicrobiae bacterium]